MGNAITDICSKQAFSPLLEENYARAFDKLIHQLGKVLNGFKIQLIEEEHTRNLRIEDTSVDFLKYKAVISVLLDLMQQGWVASVEKEKLFLSMGNETQPNKDYVRARLSSERTSQFKQESVKQFISKLEKVRVYKNEKVSIKNLFGNPMLISERIQKNSEEIVIPYIQLVSDERDEFTGLKLSEIWRYFRYTWSIPYKTMPGRNLFYLVRDAAQKYHPVIGIYALGNTVLNLTVRDDEIGWTVDGIKQKLKRKQKETRYTRIISEANGKQAVAKNVQYVESEEEHLQRVSFYAEKVLVALQKNISKAINELYCKDLDYDKRTKNASAEKIDALKAISDKLSAEVMNNKKSKEIESWSTEAETPLFRKKRALELSKLLSARSVVLQKKSENNVEWLSALLKSDDGKKAVHTALIANRKNKIGSNMMEIIVCGAIPPYNELLGGKLVSMLACSPQTISDYTNKYENQISEIASRMSGKKIVRDSHLVFLGTTSLYSIGSSQYNRIRVPSSDRESAFEYKKMGVTEGFGSIYFSKSTTATLSAILQEIDGGKKISHIFGEGTSPRFRILSRGLSTLGLRANAFLQHYSPRIVYSIELARNTNDFLLGFSDRPEYYFNINDKNDVNEKTSMIIKYWHERWLRSRLDNKEAVSRLKQFRPEDIMLGKEV